LKYACLLAERGQQIARVQGKLAQVHRRLEADMLEPTDFVGAPETQVQKNPGLIETPQRLERSLTGAALRSYLAEYASFADVSVTA
jgi:hypothetical protein